MSSVLAPVKSIRVKDYGRQIRKQKPGPNPSPPLYQHKTPQRNVARAKSRKVLPIRRSALVNYLETCFGGYLSIAREMRVCPRRSGRYSVWCDSEEIDFELRQVVSLGLWKSTEVKD